MHMCLTSNSQLILSNYLKSLAMPLVLWSVIAKSKYFCPFALIANFDYKYFQSNVSYE